MAPLSVMDTIRAARASHGQIDLDSDHHAAFQQSGFTQESVVSPYLTTSLGAIQPLGEPQSHPQAYPQLQPQIQPHHPQPISQFHQLRHEVQQPLGPPTTATTGDFPCAMCCTRAQGVSRVQSTLHDR